MMARITSNPVKHEWPLMVAALNKRVDRRNLRPGEMSDVRGIDGRYTGALRKWPGMDRIKALDSPETKIPTSKWTSTSKLKPEPKMLSPSSPYALACSRERSMFFFNSVESWRV